jgi:mono/diheme cytochrome c family protein
MTLRRRALVSAGVALALVAAVAALAWWRLLGRVDAEPRMNDEQAFRYGSVGTEPRSLPLYVWEVLPEICRNDLPGGYASIGFRTAPGHDLPVGVSTRRLGVPRAGFNCALCHVGSYRTSPEAPRVLVDGMPAHQFDLQHFTRFAVGCLTGPQFSASAVMAAIERRHHLDAIDRVLYRLVLVPALRSQGRQLAREFAWFDSRPDFGPGRFDGLSAYKDMRKETAVPTVDFMSVWRQGARKGQGRHWDGNTMDPMDSAVATAMGVGATADSLDVAALERVSAWLRTLPAPAFPFPVDEALAASGRTVFDAACATCHAPGGARQGQVIPVEEVGTDRGRHDGMTAETARAMNALGAGHPWSPHGYHPTAGYVAVLLDGVWARAPYLHNGAIPTLAALLAPAHERPRTFYRGYDVYDPMAMGFVWSGAAAAREGVEFDTTRPGNGNGGHEYGTDLSAEDKRALIEYLKTL